MLNENRTILAGQERDQAAQSIELTCSNISANCLDSWCPLTGNWVDSRIGYGFSLPGEDVGLAPEAALEHGFHVPPEHAAAVWKAITAWEEASWQRAEQEQASGASTTRVEKTVRGKSGSFDPDEVAF